MPTGFLSRLKAATNILFSGYGGQQVNTAGGWESWANWGSRPGSNRSYEETVGDLWQNSAVMACISWMQRTLPEANVWVTVQEDGSETEVEGHALSALLRRPNPYYSEDLLWQKTILSWVVSGNAYWFKARSANGRGAVRELYHIPYWQMRPLWPSDGTEFVSGYLHTVDGRRREIPAEDVVHFRFGSHPRNERLGWSPLMSGLVEIETDNEAANYEASILRNMGVTTGVLSTKEGTQLGEAAKAALRAKYGANSQGDARGGVLLLDGGMEYTQTSLSPEDLALDRLRNRPEDRICALLGIPPMVVGLTSGAQSKSYANYAEARQAAYENNIIPAQEMFAAELQLQLLPEFSDVPNERVGWDRRNVQALQPDKDAEWARANEAKKAGTLTIDEARAVQGFGPLADGEGEFREPVGRAISESPEGPVPLPIEGRDTRNGKRTGL